MELMPVYGPQFKEQIVKKMMQPYNQSVAQISRETGVAVSTLYSWKKLFRNQGFVVPAKSSRPDDWDFKAKLAAIIQTAAMNEAQRSEYCREHGLYPEQLDAWVINWGQIPINFLNLLSLRLPRRCAPRSDRSAAIHGSLRASR